MDRCGLQLRHDGDALRSQAMKNERIEIATEKAALKKGAAADFKAKKRPLAGALKVLSKNTASEVYGNGALLVNAFYSFFKPAFSFFVL